jgi:hypothetical protein
MLSLLVTVSLATALDVWAKNAVDWDDDASTANDQNAWLDVDDIWGTQSDDDEGGNVRALGSQRRRRRRRRRRETPVPTSAPDRSYLSYPTYVLLSEGHCEDYGYEQIMTTTACLTAGAYLSGESALAFNAAMPNGGWTPASAAAAGVGAGTGSLADLPGGCVPSGEDGSPPLDMHYAPNHDGQCGSGGHSCICALPAAVATTPVPYIVARENECASVGYQAIESQDACTAAGRWLARSPDPAARTDSTVGSSRPRGCAYHSSSRKAFAADPATLLFFAQGSARWPAGPCGTVNFACICEHASVQRARERRRQRTRGLAEQGQSSSLRGTSRV